MRKIHYETVLFDLDGTLLDTLDDLRDALNYALSKNGFARCSKDAVKGFVGDGVTRLLLRGMGCDGRDPATVQAFEAVRGDFREFYDAHCADKTLPYEDILPMLHALREKGIQIAVLSNKPDDRVKMLCKRFFPGIFALCVGERVRDVAGAGTGGKMIRKPSPDGVFDLLGSLHGRLETALYVGDSEVDIETARRAGVDGAFVTWGFRSESALRLAGATHLLHTPSDLITFPGISRAR